MRKLFVIINIICVSLTIGLISYHFLHGLEVGKETYSKINIYSSSQTSQGLVYDLNSVSALTKSSLKNTSLSSEQIDYLNVLTITINKLNLFTEDLSYYLIEDNKKSMDIAKISNNFTKLEEERTSLFFNISVYKEKISGSLYGDPEGTYNIFLKNVLEYTNSYAHTFKDLNNYIKNKLSPKDISKIYIYEIYADAVINLYQNFKDIYFANNTYQNINYLNANVNLTNNNLDINKQLIGGVYSEIANLFNRYYLQSNNLAIKIHDLKSENINIGAESDATKLAFYYLNILIKGGSN